MTLLKPEKRAPRPRKRITRKQRLNRVRKTSRGALGRLADKLFSLIVRQQGACRWHDGLGPCSGPLQTAHVFSRRYRSVRWDEDNAMPLCAGAHVKFTHDPLGWERFVVALMGEPNYRGLKLRAQERWDGDLESVVARLKARAAVLEIKV